MFLNNVSSALDKFAAIT